MRLPNASNELIYACVNIAISVFFTLFFLSCAIETSNDQNVSGTVEVKHVIELELPEVLVNECANTTETEEEYQDCIS